MVLTDQETALRNKQQIHGFHQEAIDYIREMVLTGADPVGSMGNDTSPAIMTDSNIRTEYKKQLFAQITNPAIHPYTEADVMSTETVLGSFAGIDGEKTNKTVLDSPVITSKTLNTIRQRYETVEIDCTFDPSAPYEDYVARIKEIQAQAENAARENKHAFLTNEHADFNKAPFQMDMVASAVHLHLLDKELRGRTSIHARAMEAHTTHDVACLLGDGVDTVNPRLVEETIAAEHEAGSFQDMSFAKSFQSYFKGMDFGLLSIMAKMGICTVESYRGAYQFEALGLGPEYISQFAPGMPSKAKGRDLRHFYELDVLAHKKAQEKILNNRRLPHLALHAVKQSNDSDARDHANIGIHIAMLQQSVTNGDFNAFLQYSSAKRKYNASHPTQIRDLWDVLYIKSPSEVTEEDLKDIQSEEEIVKHLGVASMSYGSTSPEQYLDLYEGAKKAGAKWNSGEGGLPPEIREEEWDGKGVQIASGRFGITRETISSASEVEIKIAQAAKGGEGGQLPANKVSPEIAAARNCEPNIPLVSGGAHASIKSIEDLAQLNYGLKQANPGATTATKLVAAAGIETIATGAAKCDADRINISGTGGGTGAAKRTSSMHTSMPWEIYLYEVHKMTVEQGFRERFKLSVDGGLSTPQDLAIAAMMGAEEFNFGKILMYTVGCKNMGNCHTNECAPGNASMKKENRENYSGEVENVVNFFRFMAKGLRLEMAALGVKSLDELRGRVDLIKHARMHDRGLDFSFTMTPFEGSNKKCELKPGQRNEYINPQNPTALTLDERFYKEYQNAILDPLPWHSPLEYVTNENRNIGSRLSDYVHKYFEGPKRNDHMVILNLEGIGAGQQLGFMLAKSISINLTGSANDSVGEGNSGGIIIVKPKPGTRIFENSYKNSIVGNNCVYGATSGENYFAGRTGTNHGNRFSGGVEINEGVGANAYRFMTGGTVVSLGDTLGPGMFAKAGGGIAYIYDPNDELEEKLYEGMQKTVRRLEDYPENQKAVFEIIRHHTHYTNSHRGDRFLQAWESKAMQQFKIVAPGILQLPNPSDDEVKNLLTRKAPVQLAHLPEDWRI